MVCLGMIVICFILIWTVEVGTSYRPLQGSGCAHSSCHLPCGDSRTEKIKIHGTPYISFSDSLYTV